MRITNCFPLPVGGEGLGRSVEGARERSALCHFPFDMEEILQHLNLGTFYQGFSDEHIDLDNVLSLSDQDLNRLAIERIGDRARLPSLCRQKQQDTGNQTSCLATIVAQERPALFGAASTSRKATSSSKTSKKGQHSRGTTWSVQFVCMADQYATKVPSSTENQILFKAGLGLKRIKFYLDDDELEVKSKITSDMVEDGVVKGFSKLRNCGGFELMSSKTNCRDLNLIKCSWAAKELKSYMGGGQAKIYIRSIQKSLSTKALSENVTKSLIKERCYLCHKGGSCA